MKALKHWWFTGISPWVKLVFLVLLANGLPALIILMTIPSRTETFFVWTIKPELNARLIAVMYSNAILLVAIGFLQKDWAHVRIIMVVITLFSILATLLTFFYLKPFLAHPWYHLTYWLTMYLILFFVAPYVFVTQERRYGGRLSVDIPLNGMTRLFTVVMMALSLLSGLALLFRVDGVNQWLPWTLPPLVAGLIGVLFVTHAAAYGWALWDGDWLRVRPMFWQAPVTTFLFLLLPLTHPDALSPGASASLTWFHLGGGLVILASLLVILSYRTAEQALAYDAR